MVFVLFWFIKSKHCSFLGNSWGCESSGCGIGYGKQETFRNCADIQLYSASQRDNATVMNPDTVSATTHRTNPNRGVQENPNTTLVDSTAIDNIPAANPTARMSHQSSGSHNYGSHCSCAAVAPYGAVPGMRAWCCINCSRGFCPNSHCVC